MHPVSDSSKLEPILAPKAPKTTYPRLQLLVQRLAVTVIFSSYCALAGVCFGLAGLALTPLAGACIGGAIGALTAIAIIFFAKFPTQLESYRQECLIRMKKGTSNQRALSALNQLENFFHYPLKRFSSYHALTILYNEITAITQRLDPERRDILQIWAGFLQHLHGLKATMPTGEEVALDFSKNLETATILARGGRPPRPQVNIAKLSFFRSGHLKEIEKIQTEVLGAYERYTADELDASLRKRRGSCCFTARDNTMDVLAGFGWYYDRGDAIEIACIARGLRYAHWGIGSSLLYEILSSLEPEQKPVQVHIRKSNLLAQRFFQKWGFEAVETVKNHYADATSEDALLMRLNWERYAEIVNPA